MKVMISGGGTGGHIYPAMALIKYLQKNPDNEFLYIGTEKGLEHQIVTKANIPFKTLELQGFKRKLSLDNIKTISLFLKAIKDAKVYIDEFKPDIVIGTGGYVCSAVVYAAAKKNIPTIIHEQNSVAGLTNKFLSRYVDKIAICFANVEQYFPKNKVILTGNPRGQEVVKTVKSDDVLQEYGLNPNKRTILIFGGSRGAYKFNQAFEQAYSTLASKDYQVVYVSGKIYYEELMKKIKDTSENIVIKEYISDMPAILSAVDAVLVRSGATTIAEITALEIPSILVPSPNVTNDHQTKNAQEVVDAGAGRLVKDNDLDGDKLVEVIDDLLLNEEMLDKMQQSAKNLGIKDASVRLEKLINELIAK